MISKMLIKETKELLCDFGILKWGEKFTVPKEILTDQELERWRKDTISKYLDDILKKDSA